MIRVDKERENCISSELSNLISEFECGSLTKEDLLSYISNMLIDGGVDSTIVVNVLERDFGEEGKQQALAIKINEGW